MSVLFLVRWGLASMVYLVFGCEIVFWFGIVLGCGAMVRLVGLRVLMLRMGIDRGNCRLLVRRVFWCRLGGCRVLISAFLFLVLGGLGGWCGGGILGGYLGLMVLVVFLMSRVLRLGV